jgi:hypothetical protein
MFRLPISRLQVIAALALPVAFVACGRDAAREAPVTTTTPAGQSTAPPAAAVEDRDNALVRVVHAMPTADAVDVYGDDQRLFDAVAYKSVTPYREVEGQRYAIDVRAAGAAQTEPLGRNVEGFDDGGHYTVFAVPGDDNGKASLRIVKDDHSTPASGKARLRVVHASSEAGEIDVFVTGQTDPIVDGVNVATVSDYDEIDPVTGALEVRQEGQARALHTLRGVQIEPGRSYTVVLTGRVNATPRLDAFVIEDRAETAAVPAATR